MHLIRHELVIGRVLQWEEAFEKGANLRRPDAATIAAAGFGAVGLPVAQEVSTELVEAGFTDAEMGGGSRCVQSSVVEIRENAEDEAGGSRWIICFFSRRDYPSGGRATRSERTGFFMAPERGKFATA